MTMIQSFSLDRITAADVEALVARQVPESQTLEYKEALPFNDSGKFEFLKDVTAMANASGGTIVYGVREGDGELASIPIGINPLEVGEPRSEAIDQLLSDGVEERISGIRHKPLPCEHGQLYLIRVPQSPLAPHMITKNTSKPRFYQRVNTVAVPMNVQQIKDMVLRSEGAVARAKTLIDERTSFWRNTYPWMTIPGLDGQEESRHPAGHVLLHVLPLYPPLGGVDLTDAALRQRFEEIPPLYCDTPTHRTRMSLLGYTNEEALYTLARKERSATLLRSGGIEFHAMGTTWRHADGQSYFNLWDLEIAVLRALQAVAEFAASGLTIEPAVVSLRLFSMVPAIFRSPHFVLNHTRVLSDGDALIEPMVMHGWEEWPTVSRHLFDVVWQACGFTQSLHYEADGARKPPAPAHA
jgi:Putative DNA-binding domain